jgi:AraC family transcriptional regulator
MKPDQYINNIRADGTAAYLDVNPETPPLSSRGRGWEGIVVEREHFLPFDNGDVVYDEHFIGIVLGHDIHLNHAIDGNGHEGDYQPGDLIVSPSGQPVRWALHDESDAVIMAINPSVLQRVVRETTQADPTKVQLVGRSRTRDPFIQQVAAALMGEIEAAAIGERLYVDSLLNLLTLHLIRHYSSLSRPLAPSPDRRLSGPALRRAIDAIHDRLELGISLPEVAEAAGISASHFVTLFKRSTGLTPHQYLIRARVERAKELLRHGDLSLTQVAARAGFCDQSHLNRHFKRTVGVTPARYREMS